MIIFEGMNVIDCTDYTRRVFFQRNKVMIELKSVFHPAMAGVVPSRVLSKLMKFQKSSRIQFKNYASSLLDFSYLFQNKRGILLICWPWNFGSHLYNFC